MLINFIKSKEALLILLITVLSYMSAISFEYGYAYHFDYPMEFITLDSKFLFVGLLYLFFNITCVMLMFFTPWPENREKAIKLTTVTVFIMIIFIVQSYRHGSKYCGFFVLTLSIATVTYLISRIVKNHKRNPSYLIWSATLPLIAIMTFSFLIGLQQAALKKEFNYFHDQFKDYVIIRLYDGNLIAKEVDIKEHRLGSEILYIPSYNPDSMRLKKITIEQ
ncbi:hypothetical protein ACR70V_17180 [Klebsiella pneumoniae]|nr:MULTISPECIES: hypothetical protein [Klebsiella]MCJ9552193.1 hypothetical protein [Klebsiella quasipneumoniae]HCI6736456.1 hypothetical protein [Klebsiella quasipneumoniae subsp. quasipneumoniae]HCJ8693149.1 hypothetical protein [Escherichia coli]ELA0362067.1 hypothetical protein [Klebsiella pneumoniae]ELA0388354.1 hypothetical protein [Klebsiella pneumoniae]